MYKEEGIKPIGRGFGINYERYINEILLPYLYDFYEKVQKRNPGKKVWLIEDNAGPHKKASRLMEEVRKRRGILTVDWPANSPFLHPIEDIWGPLKVQLQPTWKNIRGSSKSEKEKAYKAIQKAWYSEDILWVAEEAVEKWPVKLQKCIDQREGNSFKG